ncbi:MAG TPA: hypothetical protein VFV19_02390 [Candidatus Polarisedimenticolaceae bacterium]|nr:hypothetical protein [Candidatus Polarisedimenticolaceae bacterium]
MSAHLDPAGFDALTGAARREAVDHLRVCSGCRASALAHDPTILFALLDRTPVPARILDDVASGVRREIQAVPRPQTVRRFAAAAMLALALVCGFVAGRSPLPAPASAIAVLPHDLPRAAVDVSPQQAVSGVVDFSVGETQVVMVYNGDLHL